MRERETYWGSREDRKDMRKGYAQPPTYGRSVGNLDTSRIMDELNSRRQPLPQIMDRYREKYPDAFDSGKAMTALIAAAARRRMIRVAYELWEWINRYMQLSSEGRSSELPRQGEQ